MKLTHCGDAFPEARNDVLDRYSLDISFGGSSESRLPFSGTVNDTHRAPGIVRLAERGELLRGRERQGLSLLVLTRL